MHEIRDMAWATATPDDPSERAALFNGAVEGFLDGVLGYEFLEVTPERARGRFPISGPVLNAAGNVHPGAYAAFAESLCSGGTFLGVVADGRFSVGHSNKTSVLQPASAGWVHADARPLHRGRTSWVWCADMTDDGDNLVATSRITLAVLEYRAAP